jgi:ketopantoate reductase
MKVNILKIVVLILFLACSQTLRAQTEESLLQQIESNKAPLTEVLVTQNGNGNEAFIQQADASHTNGIETLQKGNTNYISLSQSGYYNAITIEQHGSGNIYDADIEGDNVRMDVSQHGFENIISQSLLLNNTGYTIIQDGNNNEIVQTGSASNSMGLQIQQQGSGMKLIIQSN